MTEAHPQLKRDVRLGGAVLLGLGSILGTGVFVSLGLAAGLAGPAVILAVALAGVVALCNALSSAQLAASHPVSGGTYEYGYIYLRPWLGFTAGWMFLVAKSASAATAALGLAGYLMTAAGQEGRWLIVGVALAAVVVITLIVVGGIRRSNVGNAVLVAVTMIALAAFVIAGLPGTLDGAGEHLRPFFDPVVRDRHPALAFLYATALMFVAYTGYGRLATLGEEVIEPRRTIPRAIVITLAVSVVLYIAVAVVGVASVGSAAFFEATRAAAAPLELIARSWEIPGVGYVMTVGAITAMGGVLLNLLLGLSRVMLAMGRRRDMPGVVAKLNVAGTTPWVAVLVVAVVIAALVLIGDVLATWSLSAFTVLVYYGITNLAAIRMPAEQRLYPAFIPWIGLVACIGLALTVSTTTLIAGAAVLVAGWIWFAIGARRRRTSGKPDG